VSAGSDGWRTKQDGVTTGTVAIAGAALVLVLGVAIGYGMGGGARGSEHVARATTTTRLIASISTTRAKPTTTSQRPRKPRATVPQQTAPVTSPPTPAVTAAPVTAPPATAPPPTSPREPSCALQVNTSVSPGDSVAIVMTSPTRPISSMSVTVRQDNGTDSYGQGSSSGASGRLVVSFTPTGASGSSYTIRGYVTPQSSQNPTCTAQFLIS
jgi:hypothetical protein